MKKLFTLALLMLVYGVTPSNSKVAKSDAVHPDGIRSTLDSLGKLQQSTDRMSKSLAEIQ